MLHYDEILRPLSSETLTHGIRVRTESRYVPEKSDPRNRHYFFTHTIWISNEGAEPARLLTRSWRITDGTGYVRRARGSGVTGKQPRLEPGETFTYTSPSPLPAPIGHMRGCYHMVRDNGELFNVFIGEFLLLAPPQLN